MNINYRSIEIPLQTSHIYFHGKMTFAQSFGYMVYEGCFSKFGDNKLKDLDIFIYDSKFRVVKTTYNVTNKLMIAELVLARDDGRIGFINVTCELEAIQRTVYTRDEILARELMKVAEKTGGTIQTYGGSSPFGKVKEMYRPKGKFYFSTDTSKNVQSIDYIFIDILTKEASDRYRRTLGVTIPHINYTPKNPNDRYKEAKKQPVAKKHIARVGDATAEDARRIADAKARTKAYSDWYNSLSPAERKEVNDRSIERWEKDVRPYRNS